MCLWGKEKKSVNIWVRRGWASSQHLHTPKLWCIVFMDLPSQNKLLIPFMFKKTNIACSVIAPCRLAMFTATSLSHWEKKQNIERNEASYLMMALISNDAQQYSVFGEALLMFHSVSSSWRCVPVGWVSHPNGRSRNARRGRLATWSEVPPVRWIQHSPAPSATTTFQVRENTWSFTSVHAGKWWKPITLHHCATASLSC